MKQPLARNQTQNDFRQKTRVKADDALRVRCPVCKRLNLDYLIEFARRGHSAVPAVHEDGTEHPRYGFGGAQNEMS
jgi:hypothetical protein